MSLTPKAAIALPRLAGALTLAATVALLAASHAGAAFTAHHHGSVVSMFSTSGGDTLVIDRIGGSLRHNRYAAGDPGFAAATDFDTAAAGVQGMPNALGRTVRISGSPAASLFGSPTAPAGELLGAFEVDATEDGHSATIDDSAATAGRDVTLAWDGVKFAGGGTFDVGLVDSGTYKAGTGDDLVRVTTGDTGITDVLTGPGDDAIIFGPGVGVWGEINGGTGTNRLDYSAYTTPVVADLPASTATGVETVTGFRDIVGGGAGDTLTGGSNPNHFRGGPGNDRLDGGAGKDILDGGGDSDTLDYSKRTGRVVASLDQNDNDGADANGDGVSEENDHDVDVEQITGGAGNDHLRGDAENNVLMGNAGNDLLEAFAGPDALDGGLGTDVIDGGDGGGDRIRYSRRTGRVAVKLDELANDGADPDKSGGSSASEEGDQDIGIEHADGGGGDDRLVGSAKPNHLVGGAGNDRLDGRAGPDVLDGTSGARDTIDYSARTGAVSVVLDGHGPDGQQGEGDIDLRIDDVIGGSSSDVLVATGNGVNILTGGPGADRLDGGGGGDTLDGGGGEDTADYSSRPATDRLAVTLDGAPGDGSDSDADGSSSANEERDTDKSIETVLGGAGPDRLTGADSKSDALWGFGGSDTLVGLSGDDELFGGTGLDTITGMAGTDVLAGGPGNDTLDGSDGNDDVYGEAGADALRGGAGTDKLFGQTENDTLDGGGGPDTLDGGGGIDLITYAARTATHPVSVRLDEQANDGEPGEGDRDVEVENVRGGAGADFLYATVAGDTIVNKLYGGPGNDVLRTTDGTSTPDQLHCEGGDGDRFAKDSHDVRTSCELPLVYRP